LEESLREATTNGEWTYAACQMRAQSHAATDRSSIDSRCRFSRRQKVQTVFLASYTPSLNSRSLRWCCIDLSNPPRYRELRREECWRRQVFVGETEERLVFEPVALKQKRSKPLKEKIAASAWLVLELTAFVWYLSALGVGDTIARLHGLEMCQETFMNTAFKFALMLGVAATVFAVPAFAGTPPSACSIVVSSVPEPATLAMLASGIVGVAVLRHWRKK